MLVYEVSICLTFISYIGDSYVGDTDGLRHAFLHTFCHSLGHHLDALGVDGAVNKIDVDVF
jgi:hypothetical protein